jgi:ribosomal-protein-alanine N-acetyltransferase
MRIADIDFCVPGDLNELCAIEAVCFDTPWNRHVIAGDLEDPGGLIYVKALLTGVIAGYGVLGRSEDVSHLMNLAVRPEYRRMGIASQLMLSFGEISREWECRRMRLEVRSSNREARDFYAKLGFIYKMRIRKYYVNGEDALVLVARLPLVIS